MPGKPKSRTWNDVQTAIATVAIVATLGLWNLFAAPTKVEAATPNKEPVPPPMPDVPVESQAVPTAMPYVKGMFTQPAPHLTVVQQVQQVLQPKKKKNRNKNNGGSSVSITQTKSS